MSVRMASYPDDAESIRSLLRLIDLTIYPDLNDIRNPNDQWFVCEEMGEIIGCVAARKGIGEIRHIVVMPEHQRKGIGSQLANCAIEFLADLGYSRIWAQVRVKNAESQGLFEKLGFRRERRRIRSLKNPEVELYKYVLAL